MKSILKTAVVLGLTCMVWQLIMGLTGWYLHPVLLNLFWIVILIQIGVMVWGLRLTAAEGRTYSGQLWAGTLMSVLGGVIIFLGSMLFTTVLFPHYFEDIRRVGEEVLKAKGMTAAEVKAQLDIQAPMQTPVATAIAGFLGTIVTGFIISLIAGAVIRKKPAPAA